MPPKQDTHPRLLDMLEPQAIDMVLSLCMEDQLTQAIQRLAETEAGDIAPWLLCYQAMEQRLMHADHVSALRLAQVALSRFERLGDADGYARTLAEAAFARYHLGQYATALAEIAACPPPGQPACVAALALAAYINHVGINAPREAIRSAQQGLRALEDEADSRRRAVWRIVLQRNLTAAYHYTGDLAAARRVARSAGVTPASSSDSAS
jgi:hypothetical protein